MKCLRLSILLACAAVLLNAADFTTGQAARALIGQSTFTAQKYGAGSNLLGSASGLAYANNTLFVADANRVGAEPVNHRVLIFRDVNGGQVPHPAAQLDYTTPCPVCVGSADVVLGQADFEKSELVVPPKNNSLRLPTAVASDGRILVVADTDNNRVLIWNSIPTANNVQADVVLGQKSFTTAGLPFQDSNRPTRWSLRGPQGVWVQDGRLFVADTQNHRVMIWNSIPRENGKDADVVLGQPNFETAIEPDLTQAKVEAKASNLLNPVAVTSDGQRLYVTDLGHNRVLIWNSIPTQNEQPADIALGQPDMTSAEPNNVQALCEVQGQDEEGNDLYPESCERTLSFPRFALSDGQRLFVADGGNDRVLIYSRVPTQSGEGANYVLGQIDPRINLASDAADSLRTPMSMAWDGMNLYVSDAFNRRIMVYSPSDFTLPYTAVRNAASREIYAVGSIAFGTSEEDKLTEKQELTLKIGEKEYKYKTVEGDTIDSLVQKLVDLVNAGEGDPNVFATPNLVLDAIIFTAREAGEPGNNISLSITTPTDGTITATTSGATLSGGMDAAKIAPGTVVSIVGENLAEGVFQASGDRNWPHELGGVQVYMDGIRAPLQYVSPNQINAQVPFEVSDVTSINAYVRTQRSDGLITVTTPVAVNIVGQNPGIYAFSGADPRRAVALHFSSEAMGNVSVDGSVKAGDTATVTIEDRSYTYTVKEGDTLESIRDALIELINQDPRVAAYPAGLWTRVRLKARVPGPEGNGIRYSASTNEGSQVILTATTSELCCASEAGALITDDNPALPGEVIVVYATGLGLMKPADGVATGERFFGPLNQPEEFVSALAGGKTANVLFAGMQSGQIGLHEVHLELNSDLPTNPFTQVTIAQSVYVSNIVTIPVYNPKPSE